MDACNPSNDQWCKLIDVMAGDEDLRTGTTSHPQGKAFLENLKFELEAVEGATAFKSVEKWKAPWSKLKQRVSKAQRSQKSNLPPHYVHYMKLLGSGIEVDADDNVDEAEGTASTSDTQQGTPSLEEWLEEVNIPAEEYLGALTTPTKSVTDKVPRTPPRGSGLTPSSKRRLVEDSDTWVSNSDVEGCVPFNAPTKVNCGLIDLTEEEDEEALTPSVHDVKVEATRVAEATRVESQSVQEDDSVKQAIKENTAAVRELLTYLQSLKLEKK